MCTAKGVLLKRDTCLCVQLKMCQRNEGGRGGRGGGGWGHTVVCYARDVQQKRDTFLCVAQDVL